MLNISSGSGSFAIDGHRSHYGGAADSETLRQGDRTDRNRVELFDLTGQTYPALAETLQQRTDRDRVESYFATTDSLTVLPYRLHTLQSAAGPVEAC